MPDRMETVRVVTLNTWKNEGELERRLPLLREGLAELGPDIVLLQETFAIPGTEVSTAPALAGQLGLSVVCAPARRKVRTWQDREVMSESGLAVLARGQLSQSRVLKLPSSWEGGERIALFAEAALSTGPTLQVACVHLSHLRREGELRRRQLEVVLADASWRTGAWPGVLGGDYNAELGDPELAWLPQHPDLRVGWLGDESDPAGGTHPLPPPPGRSLKRIDHLNTIATLTGPVWTVVGSGVALTTPRHGVWPSDHAAVWADLRKGNPL